MRALAAGARACPPAIAATAIVATAAVRVDAGRDRRVAVCRRLDAARADSGVDIHTVRIDGGMSVNPTFAQALADAANCPIEVSPVAEATTIGAAFMAGLGVGVFGGMDDLDDLWRPAHVVEPTDPSSHQQRRERWADALRRAGGWHADLSALEF